MGDHDFSNVPAQGGAGTQAASKRRKSVRVAVNLVIIGLCALWTASVVAGVLIRSPGAVRIEQRAAVTMVTNTPFLAMLLVSSGGLDGPAITFTPSGMSSANSSGGGSLSESPLDAALASGLSSGALNGDAVSLDMDGESEGGSGLGDGIPRIVAQYN